MASLPGKSIPTFRSVGIRREGCSVLPGYNRSKIRVHRCPSVVGFRAFRSRIFPLAKNAKGAKRREVPRKLLRVLGVLGERRFSDRKQAATGRAGEKGPKTPLLGHFSMKIRDFRHENRPFSKNRSFFTTDGHG